MSVEGAAGSELVEVVDELGHVVELVDRATMRSRNLRHRCTYVALIAGEELVGAPPLDYPLADDSLVVVHKRAEWKDLNPGFWDVAFGGVCSPGESWATSARRELIEESGISDFDLVELGPARYADDDTDVVAMVYLAGRVAGHEDVAVDADGEVVAVDVVPLADLAAWSADVPVCADSSAIVIPWLLRLRPPENDF